MCVREREREFVCVCERERERERESLQAEEYVPLPKGDVHKKKEVVQVRV